jgi:hypothetical protein
MKAAANLSGVQSVSCAAQPSLSSSEYPLYLRIVHAVIVRKSTGLS